MAKEDTERKRIQGYSFRERGTGSDRLADRSDVTSGNSRGLANFYAFNQRDQNNNFVQRGAFDQLQDARVQQRADALSALQLQRGNVEGAQDVLATRGIAAPAQSASVPMANATATPQGRNLANVGSGVVSGANESYGILNPEQAQERGLLRQYWLNEGQQRRDNARARQMTERGETWRTNPSGQRSFTSTYGSGSVTNAPRTREATIEGLPASEWYQRAANRQGVNQYAQPEPGYQGVPMTQAATQGWQRAMSKLRG